ncbi:MAG: CheR family methyltransferase, partial [Leptolyngbyaceae bacterium]|nr:CheR family methyltransferase [Leptolyngbyaceae bacterium]
KAKKGIYSSWSFRSGNSHIQQKYFRQVKDAWMVDEKIRSMVSFQTANLVQDDFSSLTSNVKNIDLIVCRNVFIYFEPQIVSQVLEKFYAALRPGGYVMTGHAELHGKNLGLLTTKVFPESVIYTRPETVQNDRGQSSQISLPSAIAPSPLPSPPIPVVPTFPFLNQTAPIQPAFNSIPKPSLPTPPTVPPQETPKKPIEVSLSQAEAHLNQGESAIALRLAEQILQTNPRHDGAYYLSAQAHANLGAYEKASDACWKALGINPRSVNPYYLLSRIAEERGDIEQAKKWLKKIIYLAPEEIMAYLDLASIYAQEGDQERAYKMRATAVEYLEKLAPQATVNHQEELTAGELLILVKKMLANSL